MTELWTRTALARDLAALGLGASDTVEVHVGLRAVGPILGGPDTLIGAIRDTIGDGGTLLVATDWNGDYQESLTAEDGSVPAQWRDHVPPFDPLTSRSMRENGAFAEFVRTTPGARRSGNPNCSMAAIGARAAWLTDGQPLDYGYGPGSPLARLVEAQGRALLIGAPGQSLTLLHHAEHLADIPDKRTFRVEIPFRNPDGGTSWRWCTYFEDSEAIVEGLSDSYFDEIVADYLATGSGSTGRVGSATAILVDAADITAFAVGWIERAAARART
ncbi:aminoglycoside 3-N-acetyltransferase [Sphingomonas sp. SFZ2018-12]|uniref:aminoglycoside 3-N-acetyltransferase n=1 Tax=Sphingomonas sp. SFZ2018-12 TaxID=2683197 RepID=UPI0008373919|nr:aminoglycoside 3-N-acetyltransferase [Sphingomonas sp. SFZ2018-12]MCH4891757.1 aminoglycoside 3-N-acetyltransferase [Sphingomonas sp. SFZ2018-12]